MTSPARRFFSAAAANFIRADTPAQGLPTDKKGNARTNLDTPSVSDLNTAVATKETTFDRIDGGTF